MELTLNEFVLGVLAVAAMLVVIFSLVSRSVRRRWEAKSRASRVICRLCLHAFEDRDRGNLVICPQCGANNEKGRSRRLG